MKWNLNVTTVNVLNLRDVGKNTNYEYKIFRIKKSGSFSVKYGLSPSGKPTGIRWVAQYTEINPNCLDEPVFSKTGMHH